MSEPAQRQRRVPGGIPQFGSGYRQPRAVGVRRVRHGVQDVRQQRDRLPISGGTGDLSGHDIESEIHGSVFRRSERHSFRGFDQ